MRHEQPDHLADLLALLNAGHVRAVIVGSHALALHGYQREMRDLDLFIDSSAENLERLIKALVEFGFDESELRSQQFGNPEALVTVDIAPHQIDFHPAQVAITFPEVWDARIAGELHGNAVFYISKELLVRNKQAAGRPKDLADLAALGEPAEES